MNVADPSATFYQFIGVILQKIEIFYIFQVSKYEELDWEWGTICLETDSDHETPEHVTGHVLSGFNPIHIVKFFPSVSHSPAPSSLLFSLILQHTFVECSTHYFMLYTGCLMDVHGLLVKRNACALQYIYLLYTFYKYMRG